MRLATIAPLILLAPAIPASDRTGWDPGFAATAYHLEAADDGAVDAVEVRFSVARPRASLRISAPWVRVDGDVVLAGSGGSSGSVQSRRGATAGHGGDTGSHGAGGPGGVAAAVLDDGDVATAAGLGDVRLQGRLLLTRGRSAGSLLARGGLKLPTADADAGLGTGETDFWAGLGWVREGWSTDLEAWAEWVSLGDAETLELEDGPSAGLALGWNPGRGRIWAGAEGWTESIDGEGPRAVAFVETRWPLSGDAAWSFEAQAGLTDASPDLGFSFGLLF